MSWYPTKESIERHLNHAEHDFAKVAFKRLDEVGRNAAAYRTPTRTLQPSGDSAHWGADEWRQLAQNGPLLAANELLTMSVLCRYIRMFNYHSISFTDLAEKLREAADHLVVGTAPSTPGFSPG